MFIPFRKKYIENYWKKDKPRLHGSGKFYKNIEKNKYYALKIKEMNKLNKSFRILDVGCGDGKVSSEVHQLYNCKVDGVDISDYFFDEYRKKKIGEFFKYNCEEKWTSIKRNYDYIYCNGVTQYLTYAEIEALSRNVSKILNSGSCFSILGLCDNSKMNYWYLRDSLENNIFIRILKFLKRGGLYALITSRLWTDGSMWHDINKVKNILHKYFKKIEIISERDNYRINIICINE